eukprot:TRINITY_DN18552_c0_g1::TRINITY_DN18552_c0_g1_i1::g.1180::m.1180 TRINITY_DN18552_c0_g1::TRINITY_DN18552_c0_g1_i1::g.1180  ORF type:complete len:239 (+),score=40.53,COX15-CtaA/PF02628.10/54,COX15-CtaA/PF02628.10/1.1,COX15-CtaA/PF02628.10/2e+03,DUF1673/PF07895.6/8.5,DUF1673/PF07895.6/3e+03 TRINITY_DN18552_c0_g1_i1:74-790(+)
MLSEALKRAFSILYILMCFVFVIIFLGIGGRQSYVSHNIAGLTSFISALFLGLIGIFATLHYRRSAADESKFMNVCGFRLTASVLGLVAFILFICMWFFESLLQSYGVLDLPYDTTCKDPSNITEECCYYFSDESKCQCWSDCDATGCDLEMTEEFKDVSSCDFLEEVATLENASRGLRWFVLIIIGLASTVCFPCCFRPIKTSEQRDGSMFFHTSTFEALPDTEPDNDHDVLLTSVA